MRGSAQARDSAAGRGSALLSIGQVLAQLTPDFPDLAPSKLRFLEEQGLVTPARTASGYRKFSPADVERLRTILTLQRDHYLPLKVIRAYLVEQDAGRTPILPGVTGPSRPTILSTGRRLSRDELLAEAGAPSSLLQEAIAASLLTPADVYGDDQLTVLKALVELHGSGIEPRHLRGLRASAERDIGLIESALTAVARRGDASARARAGEVGRELADDLETVRASIVRASIARLWP
ncbi:transcriptional regulator FtsR [Humibacter ginsenosidimutans]|uniref:MerR family transcriptional regulator n=1 Tax=Humibacter ginsenosidimutans TaxID=2599293 RepID=A0A5B8M154_9MICO|nr:MerR family transcriptional regulator [Humibacter ginsenosidimutans]QDZ13659.1 MerR family transcriptional regulator [Humibacter ginsenosidimutans]